MPRRSTVITRLALVLALIAFAARVRAADAVALSLRYRAPASCPDAEAFFSAVAARTPLARAAQPNEASTALRVVIEDVPGGNTGTLELAAPGSQPSLREVSAADCDQVVDALALMTALAIDPNAAVTPITPAPRAPAAPAPAPTPALQELPAPPAHAPARWVLELGAQLEALGGVAPDPVLLARPFVQVAHQDRTAFGNTLRLSAAYAHARVTGPEGAGVFSLWAARLEPCPLRLFPTRGFGVSACVPLEIGRLTASGSGVTPSERIARPWLSVAGAARVEWQVFEMLVLEAAAELSFPLVRDRFFVGEASTLHRAPVVAGAGSVGIGVRFP